MVDANSDGKVDEDELDILQKLLKVADLQIEETKNNNIIEQKELDLLASKIENNELETLEGNRPPELPKFIELPKDKDNLKNYTYMVVGGNEEDNDIIVKITVDYSVLKNLDEGKYYIADWESSRTPDGGTIIKSPVVRKMQESNQDGTTNWSEGINRNISKIQFDKVGGSEALIEFMNRVGEEQGFEIELLDGTEGWIEDLSIVRADKKQLIPYSTSLFALKSYDNERRIRAKRTQITVQAQGSAFQSNQVGMPSQAKQYSYALSQDNIIEGKTYLEGGNVLNTLTKNGEPAAVIGDESIKYTLLAMSSEAIVDIKDLEISEDLVNMAKKQIASELGIKAENITYIPQFDFHIDMHYRPLNDSQMAVPDYEAGINILKEFVQENQKQEYLKLITKLEDLKVKTEEISKAAENKLKENGYEIVKIPCFTDIDNGYNPLKSSVENPINYMNGICGTSAKIGDKFYITNTSGDEKLDEYMENYFKNTVGFDKVYFAPTKKYLASSGGLDCLTKEL